MNPRTAVPSWPVIDLVVQDATRGTVRGRPVRVEPGQDVVQHLLDEACALARSYGRALRVRVESPTETTELVAAPSGRTTVVATTPRPGPEKTGATTEPHSSGDREGDGADDQAIGEPADQVADQVADPDDVDKVDAAPVERAALRQPHAAGRAATVPTPTWYQVGGPGPDVGEESDADAAVYVSALPALRSAPSVRVRTSGSALRRNPLPGLLLTAATAALLVAALTIPRSLDGPATTSRPRPSTGAAATSGGPGHAEASVPDPDAAPPRPPTAQATPVPLAAAPPGYQAQPVWAVGVNGDALVDLGPDGLVTTRTPDGRVIGLDASSGKVRWWIPKTYTTGWSGPHLTRIDGDLTVVLARGDQLIYWPVPDQDGPLQDDPTSVPLPLGATLTWGGPSPLIVLGKGSAAVVHDGALQLVPLPAGARPLVADGADVLAVQGATWMRARAGAATAQTHTIATPAGATGAPVRVEAVSGTYLLAVWAKPKPASRAQTVALVDATSGKTLVYTRLPAGVDISRSTAVRQVGGSLLGVGPFVVDTDVQRLKALLAQYQIISLTPGHVYARDAALKRTVDIRTAGGQFQVLPLPAGAAVPFGAVAAGAQGATTQSLALVTTSTPAGWLLQALPAAT